MKGYEQAARTVLPGRMPAVIRVDGKAFHTYTAGCTRPYDTRLIDVMDLTAIELCKNIQGAQIAYVQSDEISILINNYKTFDTQGWFDNQVQKMVSVAASVAAATFTANSYKIWEEPRPKFIQDMNPPSSTYNIKPAFFDARVFILPEKEVCNYFIWRQQDASRNSIQMLARSLYSSKELFKKNSSDLQEMCHQKGKNWNNEETRYRRGRCITKFTTSVAMPPSNELVVRSKWDVDNEIPIFSQDREYINKHLAVTEE